MQIEQVIFYSLLIGAVDGLVNGERFGVFKPFAVFGGVCLVAGLIIRALGLGTDVLAIVLTIMLAGQIVFSMTPKK